LTMKTDLDEVIDASNEYLFAPVFKGAESTNLPPFAPSIAKPSAGCYWRTLKHLRASQIYYLFKHRVLNRRELANWPDAGIRLRTHPIPPTIIEWSPALARRIIEKGGVQFDPQSVKLRETTWRSAEITRRRFFHANYCDFLNVDLTNPEDSELLCKAADIALSWVDQNRHGTELGWGRFFLSLRIVNWLKFLARNATRADEIGYGAQVDQITTNLRIQILVLESRLERELLANHLFKNAKALIFAGALLVAPESNRWRVLGERLLLQQMGEQILPDGGHIERSPMYHAWLLDDLLDVKKLFEHRPPVVAGCREEVLCSISRMARYLRGIVHPDGEISLFNDSQFDVTRPTPQILQEAGEVAPIAANVTVNAMCDSGFAAIRDPASGSCLLFDCGDLGPDYQPGHGHADVLSYELSLHGQRVIVDTGVSSYEISPERHYERSTAAHNTVRVDEVEQAEIWAAFRVGRRPVVGPIQCGEIEGCQFVRGTHMGYRHLGVMHSRTIIRLADNSWFFVDALKGKGSHKVESFIHFHPAINLSPYTGTESFSLETMIPRWVLEFSGTRYIILVLASGSMICGDAWYSPGFAVRLTQSVLHWTWKGILPHTLVYAVVPEGTKPIRVKCSADHPVIKLDHVSIPLL
jgi:uncharacterized heparinase superfamily protein